MEHKFSIGKFPPGKRDYLFRYSVYSGKFPVERTKESCSIYIPTGISGIFGKWKTSQNRHFFYKLADHLPFEWCVKIVSLQQMISQNDNFNSQRERKKKKHYTRLSGQSLFVEQSDFNFNTVTTRTDDYPRVFVTEVRKRSLFVAKILVKLF